MDGTNHVCGSIQASGLVAMSRNGSVGRLNRALSEPDARPRCFDEWHAIGTSWLHNGDFGSTRTYGAYMKHSNTAMGQPFQLPSNHLFLPCYGGEGTEGSGYDHVWFNSATDGARFQAGRPGS